MLWIRIQRLVNAQAILALLALVSVLHMKRNNLRNLDKKLCSILPLQEAYIINKNIELKLPYPTLFILDPHLGHDISLCS